MSKLQVAYLRVSTETQTEKYGLDMQKQKIMDYCEKHGITIDKWYIDGGYSGSKLDRPEIQELLEHAKSGIIDTVYIYKLDRMSRDVIDTLTLFYKTLPGYGVKVVSMTEELRTENPMDRMMLTMNAAMNQYEREVIRMRMSSGMVERVKNGFWPGGGNVPVGYYYDRNDGILHIDNKKADIDHFRELNDAICKEHGLTVITKPEGKAMNYGEWKAEKNDSIYLRKLIRYDVDSVLLYARTPEQFQSSLEEIGYVVNLNGKHWTLKHPQSKRTFRFYKLTRDNRYDEEHLMERINSNFLFPMQSSVKDVIPCKEYQGNHRKLKGIKAMYIRYCFELGILRPKGIPQKYPSPALRKDLIYMEKITDENTFVGKHNLESIEDVLAFKLNLNNQIENWMNQRRSIYNKIKRTRDPELKKQLEQDRDTLTSKIAHGKKEIRICEDIEKRVPDIEEKLKMVNALETERMQTQKEYERSLNL